MGKFFGLDSPFFKVMTKVADFIILNFLVLVFSIPVVTIGPALTAMYYVALRKQEVKKDIFGVTSGNHSRLILSRDLS